MHSVKEKSSCARKQINCVNRSVIRVHHVEINENGATVDYVLPVIVKTN